MENFSRAIVALVLALSIPAYAQGPGWTGSATVVELVNTVDGGVNIRLSPELTGCVSNGGYGPNYASIYPNHAGINRIKADLLVAFSLNKKVALYLNNSSCLVTDVILRN